MLIQFNEKKHPDLDLELEIRPSLFSLKKKLIHKGQLITPTKSDTGIKYEVPVTEELNYTIKLLLTPFDPKIVIDREKFDFMPKLKWYNYLIGGLPFILIIVGGALGGVIGGLAWFANMNYIRFFEGNKKYVYVAGISIAALITYFIVATAFLLMFPQ